MSENRKITQLEVKGRTLVNLVDESPSGSDIISISEKSSVLVDDGLTDTNIIPHNGMPMKEAYLLGDTKVNEMQESFTDGIVIPYNIPESQSYKIDGSRETGNLNGLTLKGQSYVNALQHDSEEEYVVLGESLEFQEKKVENTSDGQIKSAMLKGQTLVNLATITSFSMTVGGSCSNFVGDMTLTPNTYTIIADIEVLGTGECIFAFYEDYGQVRSNTKGFSKSGKYIWTENIINTNIESYGFYVYGTATEATYTLNNLVILEGDHTLEDIPFFEGMKSVTVSTKLENLCHKYNSSVAKNGKTFNTNSLSERVLCLSSIDVGGADTVYGIKPNTKYLVQFKISNLVLDGLSSLSMQFSVSGIVSGNCLFTDGIKARLITTNGIYRVILTTTDLVSTSGFEIKGVAEEWEDSGSTLRSLTISDIMCVEYQNGMENWDLPYFEDYQVMKPVQVESVNKNLLDPNKIEWNSTGRTPSIYVENLLKANTSYTISFDTNDIDWRGKSLYVRDKSQNNLQYAPTNNIGINGRNGATFTITQDMVDELNDGGFLVLYNGDVHSAEVRPSNIQLEESSTATSFVPHQSKTTYSWDEVILRKVGDVEDTLDLTTGEWVQRIGEVTLDGSENWFAHTQANLENTVIFSTSCQGHKVTYKELCNQFKGGKSYWDIDEEGFYLDIDEILIRINKAKLSDESINSFKQYLQSNPIIIQYVLATPIVHKVNLSRPNLQVYDDITHVHTRCLDGTLIPNIYLPSDVSYPAILEPSKKYNVCINHTKVSANNPLKVNVGGTEITMTDSRMTLTTPATLANSNVSFTGKGNRIKESMLIKNSSLLTRDLPHFNGIGSVQLGKTIENLCSGRYIKGGSAQATPTDALDTVKITTTTQGSYVLEFPILTPLENGKTYFVYAPVSGGWANYSFVRTYNNSKSYLRQPMGDMENPQQYIVTIDQLDNQYASLCTGCHGAISVGTTYTITRPIICEYEPGMENWDWESIGYFTGTKNIGNEFMRVQNKNLININANNINNYFRNILPGALSNTYDNGKLTANNYTNASHGKGVIVSLKPNTQYTISARVTNSGCISIHDRQTQVLYDIRVTNNQLVKIITTNNNTEYCITFATVGSSTNEKAIFEEIQLEESSTATTYTAHKHNGLYITKDQPIELTWEQGNVDAGANTSWNDAIQYTISKRIRTNLITLKPNTSYRVSLGNKNYMWYLYAFDGNNVCPHPNSFNMKPDGFMQADFIFTTTQQLYKIALVGRKAEDTNITPSESVHAQIRLEEVTDVVLRGIGDVHDELDVTKGIYTQRIGEIVLDGSEAWTIHETKFENTIRFKCLASLSNHINTFDGGLICNNFESKDLGRDNRGVQIYNNMVLISFNRTELQTLDNNGVKQWLANTPTIINYQLATPIVHQVHIGNKNESNTEVNTIQTYDEVTHVDCYNGDQLIPTVVCEPKYQTLVKPSTQYSIFADIDANGHELTDITYSFGNTSVTSPITNRKCLITTPATLDDNSLSINTGGLKVTDLMVIEGDVIDSIEYFEGMKSVEAPTYTSTGKNLFSTKSPHFISDSRHATRDGETFTCTVTSGVVAGIGNLDPNKTYTISFTLSKTDNISTSDMSLAFAISKFRGEYTGPANSLKTGIVYDYKMNDSYKISHTATGVNLLEIQGGVGFKYSDIQIEESSSATSYEPYKINTLSTPSDLVLRSVGNVSDKLDLNTGKLVRYIGEMTLDGSEDENWSFNQQIGGIYQFVTNNVLTSSTKLAISPSLKSLSGDVDDEGIWIYLEGNLDTLVIHSSIDNLNDFTTWLSNNPITVQYILATPVVETINLTSNGNYTYLNTTDLKSALNSRDGNTSYFYASGYLTSSRNGNNIDIFTCNRLQSMHKSIENENSYNMYFTTSGGGHIEFYLKGVTNPEQAKTFIDENKLEVTYLNKNYEIADNICKLPIYFQSGHMQLESNSIILPKLDYSIPTQNYYRLDRANLDRVHTFQFTNSLRCNDATTDNITGSQYLSKTTNTLINKNVYYANGFAKRDLVIVEGDQTSIDFPTFYGLKNVVLNDGIRTVGKNMVDMTKFTEGRLDSGILGYEDDSEITRKDNQWISFNTSKTYRGIVSDYIKLTPNTYYTISTQPLQYCNIALYDINRKYIATIGDTENIKTFNSNNYYYARIYAYLQTASSNTFRIQMEKGTEFTGFEPYQEIAIETASMELMGIGDDCDIVDVVTNTKTSKCGKVVFDGETVASSKFEYNDSYHLLILSGIPYKEPFITLEPSIRAVTWNGSLRYGVFGGDIGVHTRTREGFIEYFSKNPATLIYRLQTESTTNTVFDQATCTKLLENPLKTLYTNSELSPSTDIRVEAPEKQTVTTQNLPSGKMYCDSTPLVVQGDYTNSTLPQDLTISSATNSKVEIDGITYQLFGTELRSVPNGIQDELDIKRGKLIRRVGFISINCFDYSNMNYYVNDDVMFVNTTVLTGGIYADIYAAKPESSLICNRFVMGEAYNTTNKNVIDIHIINRGLHFNIPLSDLYSLDSEGIDKWLKENNVNVYYEIETPIEEPIQILTQEEYNALETKPEVYVLASEKSRTVYNNSFIRVSSENSVNPELNYTVPMYNYYAANKLDFDTEYRMAINATDGDNISLNGVELTNKKTTDNITEYRFTTPTVGEFTNRIFKIPSVTDHIAQPIVIDNKYSGTSHRVFNGLRSVKGPYIKLSNTDFIATNDDLYLYSLPNGVHDELDMITGRLVRRVEKVELDTLEKINAFATSVQRTADPGILELENYIAYKILYPKTKYNAKPWNQDGANPNIYCSELETDSTQYSWIYLEKEVVTNESVDNSNIVTFKILKSRLIEDTVDAFKQWLVDQKVYMLFELITPEVSYIDVNKYRLDVNGNKTQLQNMIVDGTPNTSGYFVKPTLDYTIESDSTHELTVNRNVEQAKVLGDMIVKGNTVKNLVSKFKKINIDTLVNHTGAIHLDEPTKLNTDYILSFKVENLEKDGNNAVVLAVRGWNLNDTYTFTPIEYESVYHSVTQNGYVSFKWDHNLVNIQFKSILIGVSGSNNINNPSFDISNICLHEYNLDYFNESPKKYFKGLKHVENPVVTVSNKNLWQPIYQDVSKLSGTSAMLNEHFEIIGWNGTGGLSEVNLLFAGNEIIAKNIVPAHAKFSMHKLKPNTKYTFSFMTDINKLVYGGSAWVLGNATGNIFKSRGYSVFTTDSNGNFLDAWLISPLDSLWHTDIRIYDIQLHEGDTQSNNPALENSTYSANTTLYSLPDRCDELDMNTGVVTRRVGRLVLDGSEDWTQNNDISNTVSNIFLLNIYDIAMPHDSNPNVSSVDISNYLVTDRYKVYNVYNPTNTEYGLTIHLATYENGRRVAVLIRESNTYTLETFKEYLASNPVEVLYPLATPYTETVEVTKSVNSTPTLRAYGENSVLTTNAVVKPKSIK